MSKEVEVKELQDKMMELELVKAKTMAKYKEQDLEQQQCLVRLNEIAVEQYKAQAALASGGLVVPQGGNVQIDGKKFKVK